MKVYRFLGEEELALILSGHNEKLGKYWRNVAENNHKYKRGKKYIHFFTKESSIEYIVAIRKQEKECLKKYYICEFDIPLIHLLGHYGKGRYLELTGYEEVWLGEYAIVADKFKSEWLTHYKGIAVKTDQEISK